ncbi:MAG TPA: hypothetical protein VHB49_12485 [Bradyrhizobium sp.]|nr:hypothetical protein [Bradyrhizobium sp.]
MHSSLAVTTDGLPLGLAAIKFWNRQKFKGTAALKRKINPTRVPIEQKESFRWLENMRQSMALFGAPRFCTHKGDSPLRADVVHVWTAPVGQEGWQRFGDRVRYIHVSGLCTRRQAAGHDGVGGAGPHQAAALAAR